MSSIVAICNIGLINLGEDTISSLDDQTKRAKLCKQRYADIRDAVLRAHPWNCAIERVSIPAEAAGPTWGYANKFQLPVDPLCLRVLDIENAADMPWKIEGKFIVTDIGSPVRIRYIKRVEDSTEYDALLVQAIGARIAADLAMPLTQSQDLMKSMWSLYVEKLREARGIDGQEGTPDQFEDDTWIGARN